MEVFQFFRSILLLHSRTNSFFAYATVYLVLHGERFTLAVAPVTRSESLKRVLQELLAVVTKAGLRIGLLLLDRGQHMGSDLVKVGCHLIAKVADHYDDVLGLHGRRCRHRVAEHGMSGDLV